MGLPPSTRAVPSSGELPARLGRAPTAASALWHPRDGVNRQAAGMPSSTGSAASLGSGLADAPRSGSGSGASTLAPGPYWVWGVHTHIFGPWPLVGPCWPLRLGANRCEPAGHGTARAVGHQQPTVGGLLVNAARFRSDLPFIRLVTLTLLGAVPPIARTTASTCCTRSSCASLGASASSGSAATTTTPDRGTSAVPISTARKARCTSSAHAASRCSASSPASTRLSCPTAIERHRRHPPMPQSHGSKPRRHQRPQDGRRWASSRGAATARWGRCR